MANIIEIVVKGTNLTKTTFDEVKADARAMGQATGDSFSKGVEDKVEDAIPPVVDDSFKKTKEPARKSGSETGAAFTQAIDQQMTARLSAITSGQGAIAGSSFSAKFSEATKRGITQGSLIAALGPQLDEIPARAKDAGEKTGAAFVNGANGQVRARLLSDADSIVSGRGAAAGSSFAVKFSEGAKKGMTQGSLLAALGPGLGELGVQAGDGTGFNFTQAMGGRVRGELPQEVEKPLEDSGKKAGGNAGAAAGDSFAAKLGPLVIGGFALAASAGPGLILAATATAVLGAGALITKGNADLQSGYQQLGHDASLAITQATAPLVPALAASIHVLGQGIPQLGAELKAVFAAVAPDATALTRGVLALADNALPGIAVGLRAIAPYSGQIAADFGKLGAGIGGLFSGLAGGAGGGMTGFNAIIDVASHLLTDIGQITGALANGLGPALHDIDTVAVPVATALTDMVKALPPGVIRAAADATLLLFGAFQVGKLAGVVSEGATFVTFLKEAATAEGAMTLAAGTATAATATLGAAIDVAIGPLGVLAVAYTAVAQASDLFSGKSSKGGLAGVVEKERDARNAVKAHSDAVTAAVVAQDAFTTSLLAASGAAGTSAQQSATATLAALGLTDGTSSLTTSLYNTLQAFTLASGASSAYGTALDALFGKYQSYSDTQAAFTIGLGNAAKSLKDSSDGFRTNTATGAANYQLMSQLATANENRAEALLKETGSQAQANRMLQAGALAIDQTARSAGFGKAQIDALNVALYGTKNIGAISVPISADTDPALNDVRSMIRTIDSQAAYIQVYASAGAAGGHQLLAHGGVVAATAAVGGSRGGLTWMNEQGPELVRLPSGSTVFSNPDTMRMLGEAGGVGDTHLTVEWVGSGNAALDALWAVLRGHIRFRAGTGPNSVQQALGQN